MNCGFKEILKSNDVKTWELRDLGFVSRNLIKRLIGFYLFRNTFSPKSYPEVHYLFSSILNLTFIKLLQLAQCWKAHEIWHLLVVVLPNSELYWPKSRPTKKSEDLASKLQLGQDKIPFEDYTVMEGEDVFEVEYYIS